MKATAVAVAGMLFMSGVVPVLAGEIQNKENKQEHKIEKGARSGKITPKEQQRLDNEQRTIDQERKDAWADGKMSKRERQDIKHDQKRLGQDIKKKKENGKKVQH